MLSQGSGTSPTLLGERWVAIADNADPQTNILVYDRRKGVSDRLHCTEPVLADNAGTTENSLVAAGQLVHHREQLRLRGPDDDDARQDHHAGHGPGDGRRRRLPRRLDQRRDRADVGGEGVAGQRPALRLHEAGCAKDGIDAWYFTAIDIRSGETVWSRLTGTGIQWNNHYAAIYLGPDGAAYVATLAGLVRVDRPPMKTYVVTGAASGIGAATTALLRDDGPPGRDRRPARRRRRRRPVDARGPREAVGRRSAR